jgi:hypothetical protein
MLALGWLGRPLRDGLPPGMASFGPIALNAIRAGIFEASVWVVAMIQPLHWALTVWQQSVR